MGRSGVNYGETTICNWSESHCSQWGHSFAHCALRLIYFRLYSIADRSKSPARGLPLTDVNSTVHCTTDRSVQSRRSSLFDVNLRWSTVVRSSLVSFASRLYSLSLSLSLSLATCTMKVDLATICNNLTRGFIKYSNYKNYILLNLKLRYLFQISRRISKWILQKLLLHQHEQFIFKNTNP